MCVFSHCQGFKTILGAAEPDCCHSSNKPFNPTSCGGEAVVYLICLKIIKAVYVTGKQGCSTEKMLLVASRKLSAFCLL